MTNNKDIRPRNNKGERHGYWKVYYFFGGLWYKGNYVNGKEVGYEESYYSNSNYVNGNSNSKLAIKTYYL